MLIKNETRINHAMWSNLSVRYKQQKKGIDCLENICGRHLAHPVAIDYRIVLFLVCSQPKLVPLVFSPSCSLCLVELRQERTQSLICEPHQYVCHSRI